MPAVMLLVFALTLFCSATLLFLIEPMVGKMMLPLLGGTPAVWNTCMVFFQAVLLAGYAYSHYTTTWLGTRKQARLHLIILFLPIISFIYNYWVTSGLLAPNDRLILGRESNPIPALLLVLTLSVGLPMFVICSSAPLLTRWFSSTDHPSSQDPYFLYGASNFGSMLTLLGYPLIVEPYLTLQNQQIVWVVGYAILALCIFVCAVMLWRSNPHVELAVSTTMPAEQNNQMPTTVAKPNSDKAQGITRKDNLATEKKPEPKIEEPLSDRTTRPVDWARRLYWTALALVPSSLMLGATTYITTDIAAIPLLWVLPLTLYLLTFIIVFAVISPRTQSIVTVVGLGVLLLTTIGYIAPMYVKDDTLLLLIRVAGILLLLFSLQLLRIEDPHLIHHVMVMVMPLLVLLLIFMVMSDIKPANVLISILLHLVTLFIIAMVCHGELARDRPAPSHLTEFFLLMSIGGVLGGLFNGLFAPLAFNSLVEYPFMMMVACLLLPPLSASRDGAWARWADVALGVVFFLVGGLLIFLRASDFYNGEKGFTENIALYWKNTAALAMTGAWFWNGTALLLGGVLGIYNLYRGRGFSFKVLTVVLVGLLFELIAIGSGWDMVTLVWPGVLFLGVLYIWFTAKPEPTHLQVATSPDEDTFLDRLLDFALPMGLIILILGLYWGLPTKYVEPRLKLIASWLNIDPRQFRVIMTFGLPAVLCYTFVERSVRFGLGVGAILLASSFCLVIDDSPMYQKRSFFGVLRVEDGVNQKDGYHFAFHRLVHGTTLHGKQFLDDGIRDVPLTYYHRTGPIGSIFTTYNTDPKRPFAVIGLGTGSMACYALPGQTLDFFDIDPIVVDISYDTSKYFSFVEDAEDRGADVNLVLGDARLTFEPSGDRVRLKPLRKNESDPDPERRFGKPLPEDLKYRLIVVDAFSSDAIPVHLITKQAVAIYFQRLQEDGIVLMHISNRHLDLQPVLANIAVELGIVGVHMSDNSEGFVGKTGSHWVALTRKMENVSKVMNVPRWMVDEDQLNFLAVANIPSPSPSLATNAGLCFAFQAIAQQKAEMAYKLEGGTGDPKLARTTWVPLDTIPELESQPETAKKEVAKITPILDMLRTQVKPYQQEYEKIRDPLKEVEEQHSELTQKVLQFTRKIDLLSATIKAIEDQQKKLRADIAEAKTDVDNLTVAIAQTTSLMSKEGITPEKKKMLAATLEEMNKKKEDQTLRLKELESIQSEISTELEKKLAEARQTKKEEEPLYLKQRDELRKQISTIEPKMKQLQAQFDRINGPRSWLEARIGSLDSSLKRYTDMIEKNEKALRMNKRVGVWTDDYSNILSVFKWD